MSIQLRQNAETLIHDAIRAHGTGGTDHRPGRIGGEDGRIEAFFGFRFGRHARRPGEDDRRGRAFDASRPT